MKAFFAHTVVTLLLILSTVLVYARQIKPDSDKYKRQEVMIPMRDGIKLHAVIFTPKNQSEKLPFLFQRTPYAVNKYPSPEKDTYETDMAEDATIIVNED